MKLRKLDLLGFFLASFVISLVFFSACCKKENNDNNVNKPQATSQEIETVVVNLPPERQKAVVDYGDDELGQALNAYQKNGFWFKNQKPKLIESKCNRTDFYVPFTDESGKTWQFSKISSNLYFDGEYMEKQWPVMVIYEGDENLRAAIETFVANFRKMDKDKKTDYPRTLISPEVKEISGGVSIKDSYEGPYIEHQDFYEGKKVLLFGFNYSNKEIEFMFDLK